MTKDFCAKFTGFNDEGEIRSHLVESYLEMKGHSKGSISELIYFLMVDFFEEKKVFRAHQVTRDAFRAELIERSTRHSARDLLLENFRNISDFFCKYDVSEMLEAFSFFRCVLSNGEYSLDENIL